MQRVLNPRRLELSQMPTTTNASAFGYVAQATGLRATSVGASSDATMTDAQCIWI